MRVSQFALCMLGVIFSNWAFGAKTFVYCTEASPKIFNPQLATDGPTFNASSRPLYNRLVEFESGGTRIVPGLAKTWEVSKDGKQYTFQLRKDVKFHKTNYFSPSRNFNADDVVFSFNRMLQKNHPYHQVNGGTYSYFNGMDMGNLIEKVEKLKTDKVRFQLKRPEAPFLANLAMGFASILSQEYAEVLTKKNQKELLDTQPIGTGPFIYKKYVKDNLIRYERNPDYFKGPAKLTNLVFSITPDASVRYQKLKAGECHFIAEPSPADIKKLEQVKGVNVIKKPGLNVGYLAFNTAKKPFDNALVRQALNLALNREAYIRAIYLGNATKAKSPLPPSVWGYYDMDEYEYNPEKARKLLVEAGYPKGFETDLWTLPVSRPYNPNGKKMGEMMQADLAKIGVKAKLVTYKWAEYLKRGADGEHSMIQLGWTGDNGDPDNFLSVLLGCAGIKAGSNYARWCDPQFQDKVSQAKIVSDQKVRTQLYKDAQKVFRQKAPWALIAHSTVFKAMSTKVVGYKPNPFGLESFYEVDLK